MEKNRGAAGGGCGLGAFAGLFLSIALNHSFWWGVLHFFLGWIYVLYALVFRFHAIKEWFH